MRYLSYITIIGICVFASLIVNVNAAGLRPPVSSHPSEQELSVRSMSLNDRYPQPGVNAVFRENILLALSYLAGKVPDPTHISWQEVNKPSQFGITLSPGEVFAFHDKVLQQFLGYKLLVSHAHFSASDGFLSDGYLYGDGVCHLASLLNWAARDAGLTVVAPTKHDFAVIPDIPAAYGTAIYTAPAEPEASALQNLYIENTFKEPARFVFEYSNNDLKVSIYREL